MSESTSRFGARRRGLLVAGGLAGVAAAGGAAWWGWQHAGQSVGNDAAVQAFWQQSLLQPDGASLALAQLQGQPLLVNFWATWCPPCVRELPLLSRWAQTQQGRIQVLGIAVDQASNVRRWLVRQPLAFPVAMLETGGIATTRALGNVHGGLPFTLAFDRHGNVRQRKIGELSEQDLHIWAQQLGA